MAAAEAGRVAVAAALRHQREECERLGSPLYAGLLGGAAADVEAGGPAWEVLRGQPDEGRWPKLALQLLGAVNRLVLAGEEPELAAAYATARQGGDVDAWPIFRDVLVRRRESLRELVDLPVQTNEVGRSAVLRHGFLAVALETELPLRLLELGASAGLNLNWDRYEPAPGVEVASREGCDAAPIDPTSEEGRTTLRAYVWPDQGRRVERLEAALAVAAEHPVRVDRARAGEWARERLANAAPGLATVVFHSVFIWYLPEGEREELLATIAAAGDQASVAAPLAWLRMEGPGERASLTLTTWPGGEERLLARAGYHGEPLELLESGAG